jgi:hypothetical protein
MLATFFAPAEEIESQWSECFLPESDSIMLDHAISQSEVAELSWSKVLFSNSTTDFLKQSK